jgi:hypothetical protein
MGLPMHLRELGIDESRFDEIAHKVAAEEELDEAWVPLSEADVKQILLDCL